MKQIGVTTEGKPVVAGLGKLYYETGLPLSVIFDQCQAHGQVPAWPKLVEELEQNGMKKERIMHLLNEHIFESYGKEYRDLVLERLRISATAERIPQNE